MDEKQFDIEKFIEFINSTNSNIDDFIYKRKVDQEGVIDFEVIVRLENAKDIFNDIKRDIIGD